MGFHYAVMAVGTAMDWSSESGVGALLWYACSASRLRRLNAHRQTWRADLECYIGMQNTRQNRAMKPAGVHHVAICVADVKKGLAFYRDVLGMRPLPRPDLGPGYWLDAGGQQDRLPASGSAAITAGVKVRRYL